MSKVLRRTSLIPPCVIATLVWTLSPVHAETSVPDQTAAATSASGPAIEEVVVSAERRKTDIQKTALAISSVSADALDKANVNALADTNGLVPGLEITKSSGFETVVTVRGVGSETPENAPTTSPGVAFFIDGVYIANTIALDQTLFDVDHIEVLRGPQGALYGQSSTGGAITVVTKQPQLDAFSGQGDVSFGDYSLHRERAELNVPITDTLALRVSGQDYGHDGFTRDALIPGFRLDDAHDLSGKAAILWKPTDTFSATFTTQIYSADQHGAAQKNIDDPNPDPRVVDQDYPSKFNLDTQLYALNLQYDAPWFSVKSITAYQSLDHRQQEDSSRSAISILGTYDDVAAWNTTLNNYSEELDLLSQPGSPLDWIVGVFGLDQRSTQFVAEFEGSGANPDLTIGPDIESKPPSNLAYGNNTTVHRKSESVFFQGTYHILDNLRLTLGGRYNYDSYSLNSYNFSEFETATAPLHSYTDHKPTGRIELDYDLTPDNLVYGSISRGYKPGGINGINGAVVVPYAFKPETNTAFEVGSKNFLFDHALRLNAAAFYYIYKDMQYIETDPVPFDGGMSNIPEIDLYGFEGEASYVGMERRLHVNANLAIEEGSVQGSYYTIDSTVQNKIESTAPACAYGGAYYNPACWAAVIAGEKNIGGNSPAKTPEFAGSFNVSYSMPVPTGTLTPRFEFIYRGSFFDRIFNEPALDKVGAYGIVNLNLEYAADESNLRVSLAVTNVGDRAGVNSRYTDPYGTGQTSQQFIPPRQIIGTVAYSF